MSAEPGDPDCLGKRFAVAHRVLLTTEKAAHGRLPDADLDNRCKVCHQRSPMSSETLPTAADIARVWPLGTHPTLPRTRETVAIHEAAHAVVALALGLPCHAIRIEGNGVETVGGFAMSPAADLNTIDTPEVHHAPDTDRTAGLVAALAHARHMPMQQAALDLATMAAAGRQGEILAAGLPWPGVLWSNDRDGQATRAYLACAFNRLPLGFAQRCARALLTHDWQRVQHIAAELIECGTWSADSEIAKRRYF